MGYNYATAFEEPPLSYEQTLECVKHLMTRAAERFIAEFPQCANVDIQTELDIEARTVKAWASGHWRSYSFDSLI